MSAKLSTLDPCAHTNPYTYYDEERTTGPRKQNPLAHILYDYD